MAVPAVAERHMISRLAAQVVPSVRPAAEPGPQRLLFVNSQLTPYVLTAMRQAMDEHDASRHQKQGGDWKGGGGGVSSICFCRNAPSDAA